MSLDLPAQLVFGAIEVRPAARQLLVNGQEAVLGARAFDLLLALIARRDRLLSKGELLDLVWPGLVVEENNLQVQISTLRKCLGTHAIATVPGRGYRFTLQPDADASAAAARTDLGELARPWVPRAPALHGRKTELARVLAALPSCPLLSLVGPGGIGKTSLAREAARLSASAWRDGVAWVELAPLRDAALLPSAIAQAIGLPLPAGQAPLAALLAALRPLQLLLVIDNAEHLIEGLIAPLQMLLDAAPELRLLITSQVPLRILGEEVLRLEALALPSPCASAQEALASPAFALLLERIHAADRRFVLGPDNLPALLEICLHLDGLPLALELAATRVPLLGAQGVAVRLDDRFRLLAQGARSAPSRQQTLLATLEWSLALLTPAQRERFIELGVFAGGFSLDLAHAVLLREGEDEWTLIDALAQLADHSLLQIGVQEVPRYTLSESARAYALQGIQGLPDGGAQLRCRHAHALRDFFGPAPQDWLSQSDAQWLACYEVELDNLRAALQWAQHHDPGTLVALVASSAPLWHQLSLHTEARRWHELSATFVSAAAPAVAAPWWRAAQWAWAETDPARSRYAAEMAGTLYQHLGDAHGLYALLTGLAGMWTTPDPRAEAVLAEALALERPDWPARERAWGQRARAEVARANGQLHESLAARQAELALRGEAGDERGRLRAMAHLAELMLEMGEVEAAVSLGRELVQATREARAASARLLALRHLIAALTALGEVDAAQALQPEAEALARGFGLAPGS